MENYDLLLDVGLKMMVGLGITFALFDLWVNRKKRSDYIGVCITGVAMTVISLLTYAYFIEPSMFFTGLCLGPGLWILVLVYKNLWELLFTFLLGIINQFRPQK